MKNQIHFNTEKEVTIWLLDIVNSKEEYDMLIQDLSRIEEQEKNCKEVRENENSTGNQN